MKKKIKGLKKDKGIKKKKRGLKRR